MARRTAYNVLMKFDKDQSYLNITLNDYLNQSELSRKDKDLVTNIVYGVVQNQMYLEYLLEPFIVGKKVKRKDRMILLMAIYQKVFLDKIPEYAIINEAVKLEKDRQAGKFINALLHRFMENPIRSLEGLDEDHMLSISTSHPLWLVKMLKKQYGLEQTKKILINDNGTPTRACRVNTLKTTREELLKDPHFSKGQLSQDALLYDKGNIAQTDYFNQGLVTIQDESSQLPARLLDPQKGDYVLDMCCAPGSKTTHLSALMENTGQIEAYDLYEHKIKLCEHNAKRLNATNIHFHCGDSTQLHNVYHKETFDCLLLDAPCSGLGVLKRKPEIRYHDSSEMDGIMVLQRKLLENAYYLLKKNGKMVYSTCTINKKENEKMIEQFLLQHKDMKVIEQKQILNYLYNSDGFYMCKLVKEK